MSTRQLWSQPVMLALSLVCASFFFCSAPTVLRAEEKLAGDAALSHEAFRRVFVPADSPDTWPVGSEQFLPIPYKEFLNWIQEKRKLSQVQPEQPFRVSRAIYRAELLSDNRLRGVAEWTVELPGAQPRLLPLSPLNLVLEPARWRREPNENAKVGIWQQSGAGGQELSVLVEQSDILQLPWQLTARRVESGIADYYLQKPVVAFQTLELLLPENCTATLTDGELLRTEPWPLGKKLWVFQLAARETHRLRIRNETEAVARRALPLVSQTTSYQLEPSGLHVLTQLRLDARESQISELRAALGSGLRVVDVLIDEQEVDWDLEEVAGESLLVIVRPESKQTQTVAIRCLAKLRLDVSWELPKLRFREVAWTEGMTRLLVSSELVLRLLTPKQASLQHIAGVADEDRNGEVFRLQEWSREASLEISVGKPRPNLTVESMSAIELDREEVQANIVAVLSSSGSDVFQVRAEIAAGWSIDSVSSVPALALNEWHVKRAGNSIASANTSDTLLIQLSQPIDQQQPLHLEIKASKKSTNSVLPAKVGQLQLLRFSQAGRHRELLQLSTHESQQLILPTRLQRARLSFEQIAAELPIEIRDLAEENPFGIVLDMALLHASDIIELLQQPAQYTADLQVRIEATADSLTHDYRLDFRVNSGTVMEVELETTEVLPESIQWKIVGQRGLVTMGRVDTDRQALSGKVVSYLLRLPVAMAEDFSLQASYSQLAQNSRRCNLMSLPLLPDWSGQVALFGALDEFRVVDQGWVPTASVVSLVEGNPFSCLGTYRLGAEEFRRRDAKAELRLERQVETFAAPKLIAWLAEYQTLLAADGTTLHTVHYSLGNSGASLAKITLPAGAELQEAWLDDRQIVLEQIAAEENVYQFRLEREQRWPNLSLKYSTISAPLRGSASIQPVVLDCSFPVNLTRWTLWTPEQYEIDNGQQDSASHRNHWWKRVFGPLARSRGETIFRPLSGSSWAELWSTPLEAQQTKQIAEQMASQLTKRMAGNSNRSFGELLSELATQSDTLELLSIDRTALLAQGVQANTSCSGLVVANFNADMPRIRVLPLSGYRLALLVSPGSIVLTTAQRLAHWHDQLRPTEVSGVFVVSSDDLVDRIDKLRSMRSIDLINVSGWLKFPHVEQLLWQHSNAPTLADVGHRAQTLEFVIGRPTLVVRRAYLPRALWYALVLLTLVVGIWQLGHYPNAMLCLGALMGAACLIVPAYLLIIPQSIFLGLVAAAIVRIALKASEFVDVRAAVVRKSTPTAVLFFLISILANDCFAQAQLQVAQVAGAPAADVALPRVLVPIDSEGRRQGEDVYLPLKLLEKLRAPSRQLSNDNAELVLLEANYSGSLSRVEPTAVASSKVENSVGVWELRWKVESFRSNCRLFLPLQRGDATWDVRGHRLDGIPVQLAWQPEGNGCSVLLPEQGIHWLKVVARPRYATNAKLSELRLHIPKITGATLNLSTGSHVEGLKVTGAARSTTTEQQYLLAANGILELQWNQQVENSSDVSWEELNQFLWLQVDPTVTRLEVQLAMVGLQSNSLLLELDVSPQLRLMPLGENSPVAEVIGSTPGQPTRLQLKLRPGLPTDVVIPLHFELQRADSVGHVFLPQVRIHGALPTRNQFAVSVHESFAYDQQLANDLRSMEPEKFLSAWNTAALAATVNKPLFAYSLGSEQLEWSLRVRPSFQPFIAQQMIRVDCFPNQAQVEFKAAIEGGAGQRLMHRMQVSESLIIDSVDVQNLMEATTVPLRWSRVSPTELVVFLGQPLVHAHALTVQGHVRKGAGGELELPQIELLDGERGDIDLDLYRAEDVQVSWVDSELVPQEILQRRTFGVPGEVHVGRYTWRTSQFRKFSKLVLRKNNQQFDVDSVTTVDLELAGWTAQVNSRIKVRDGVVSRIRLSVPENFRQPYVLKTEEIGVIAEEVQETPHGKELTVLLTQPAAAGEVLEIQLSGSLSLAADKRLSIPDLQWIGASQRQRFVLLPTLLDGQSIRWGNSGLRSQELPESLRDFAPSNGLPLCFRIGREQFEAKEGSERGMMSSARVRYVKVQGTLDAEGALTATAEIIFQPGRATACTLRLPVGAKLRQLVVGDQPARRELRADGEWKLLLGPPFMPQRVVVSYRVRPKQVEQRMSLSPPAIFLEDQELPLSRVWWHLRGFSSLRLGQPAVGKLISEIEFVKNSCRQPLLVLEDAMSRALELPGDEGRKWAASWQAVIGQAEKAWQAYRLSGNGGSDSLNTDPPFGILEAFSEQDSKMMQSVRVMNYPPRLPEGYSALARAGEDRFFVSDERGQLVVTVTHGSKKNLWRWFAAAALVCGTLAIVLRLKRRPYWHYDLCDWPHSLAFGAGFGWWLLLKPSALGMLVMVLVCISLALKQARRYRQRRLAALEVS